MAPCESEAYNPHLQQWIKFGKLKPGDPPATISDNRLTGHRDLYFIQCSADNSHSTIYRSGRGVDIDLGGGIREAIFDPTKLEIVKELSKGESFEMTVQTDQTPQPRLIRFTHK